MRAHRYQIDVTPLTDSGAPNEGANSLSFEVSNHDDILAIVERMKRRPDLSEDDATALAVGLKLFSEVMLKNKRHPLFDALREPFMRFMKTLKGNSKEQKPVDAS